MSHKKIDPFSVSVTKLDLFFDKTLLACATGFFWQNGSKNYLVTNWHNVTGKNNITGQHLSKKTAAEPNRVEFDTYIERDPNRRLRVSIDLYRNAVPFWIEHPRFGKSVDVVCILLEGIEKNVVPINSHHLTNILKKIGSDVFIIGYPMGIDTSGFPIWKRGSIASEPDLDADLLPLVYVDSLTIKGLSGSPVLLRQYQGELSDGFQVLAGGQMNAIVGIYSGRVGTDDSLGWGLIQIHADMMAARAIADK